jgi:hypothetical protein
MHKSGADGPDESPLLKFSVGVGHKNVSARGSEPDAQISRFACRVHRIRKHPKRPSSKCALDLVHRDAVLEALLAVPVVPVETINCLNHTIRIAIVCTNVHTLSCASLLSPTAKTSPCERLFNGGHFQNSPAGDGRSLANGTVIRITEFNSFAFGGVRQWVIVTHCRQLRMTASGHAECGTTSTRGSDYCPRDNQLLASFAAGSLLTHSAITLVGTSIF